MPDIVNNAINKIKYKANEIAYDPAANAAAEAAPQFVKISTLPSDSQILLAQMKAAIRSFRGAVEKRIETALSKMTEEQKLVASTALKRDMQNLGIGEDEDVVKDLAVNKQLYAKMVEAVKSYYLTVYSLALPDVSLDTFKEVLASSELPFPGDGDSSPGPGVPRTSVQTFTHTFTDTLFTTGVTILIVLLCTLAGSFAANDAIGRSTFIRVVYFIYASIPIFAPFVFIYYIYRYLKGRPPKFFAFLPLFVDDGTRPILGKFLAPFAYIPDYLPDNKTRVQTKIYEIISSGFVWKEEAPKDVPAAAK